MKTTLSMLSNTDGQKIDFSLEAEGLRKLALLWKLIRNGLLEKDSILLWDEPESNLNPELVSARSRNSFASSKEWNTDFCGNA